MLKARFIEPASNKASFAENETTLHSSIENLQIVKERTVLVGTKEQWDSTPTMIGEKDVVYVYSDQNTNELGQPVPGFKVGDGKAYLIDMPFNNDLSLAHFSNESIHVTDEERDFWNNKVTAFINAMDPENLVLTKNKE